MNQLKTRLAPTPSGFLHIGNLLVFACSWRLARLRGGSLLLRIDDLDGARKRPAFLHDIFDSLQWLGIDWDEGPRDVADFEQHWSQFHRLVHYEHLLTQLRDKDLLYACNCSRKQLEKVNPAHRQHSCRHQKIAFDTPEVSWRIRIPENSIITFEDHQRGLSRINLREVMPDFVVKRKDGLPAYQIASLADDLYFGISHIVRGEDLLASTAAQIFLARILGFSSFENTQWWHLPLITDAFGRKLSKSQNDRPVAASREAGQQPEVLWAAIDRLLT